MRKQKFNIPFKDIANKDCRIEVWTEGYTGSVVTLTAAVDPFVYNEEKSTQTFGVPIRALSGYIRVIDNGDCDELVATSVWQHQVKVYQNNDLVFIGYIQPRQMTQDWQPTIRELEVPVISPLGLLSANDNTFDPYQYTSVAKLFLELLNSVYTGYTNFVFRGGQYDYEIINQVWSNSLWVHENDEFPGLEDDGYTSKPEFIHDDCKKIMETLCNFYDYTVREQGNTIFFDKAITGMTRAFSRADFTAMANQTGSDWNTKGQNSATKCNVVALTSAFKSYDDKKGKKSISEGWRKVWKTYKVDEKSDVNLDIPWDKIVLDGGQPSASGDKVYKSTQNRYNDGAFCVGNCFYAYEEWDKASEQGGYYDKGTKHSYSPQKGVRFYNQAQLTLKSRKAINMKQAAIVISGSVNGIGFPQTTGISGNFVARLKVGDYYWNGANWSTSASTFNVYYGPEDDAGTSSKILCNADINTCEYYGVSEGLIISFGNNNIKPVGRIVFEFVSCQNDIFIPEFSVKGVWMKDVNTYNKNEDKKLIRHSSDYIEDKELSVDMLDRYGDIRGENIQYAYSSTYSNDVIGIPYKDCMYDARHCLSLKMTALDSGSFDVRNMYDTIDGTWFLCARSYNVYERQYELTLKLMGQSSTFQRWQNSIPNQLTVDITRAMNGQSVVTRSIIAGNAPVLLATAYLDGIASHNDGLQISINTRYTDDEGTTMCATSGRLSMGSNGTINSIVNRDMELDGYHILTTIPVHDAELEASGDTFSDTQKTYDFSIVVGYKKGNFKTQTREINFRLNVKLGVITLTDDMVPDAIDTYWYTTSGYNSGMGGAYSDSHSAEFLAVLPNGVGGNIRTDEVVTIDTAFTLYGKTFHALAGTVSENNRPASSLIIGTNGRCSFAPTIRSGVNKYQWTVVLNYANNITRTLIIRVTNAVAYTPHPDITYTTTSNLQTQFVDQGDGEYLIETEPAISIRYNEKFTFEAQIDNPLFKPGQSDHVRMLTPTLSNLACNCGQVSVDDKGDGIFDVYCSSWNNVSDEYYLDVQFDYIDGTAQWHKKYTFIINPCRVTE